MAKEDGLGPEVLALFLAKRDEETKHTLRSMCLLLKKLNCLALQKYPKLGMWE